MNINRLLNKIFQINKTEKWIIPKSQIYKFLPRNPVILEAGAHIGLDTVQFSKDFPNGVIYAFEPIPELFDELVKRTNIYPNTHTFKLALSDQPGNAKMFISSGASDASSSLLQPKEHLIDHPDVKFNSDIVVDCVTLDEWSSSQNINKINLLWLDLQGYELNVLKAGLDILRTVDVIYTEVNLKEAYKNAPLYNELREWLEDQGFRVQKEAIPWKDAGNVLFVRETQK